MAIKIGVVHIGQAIENRMHELKMTQRELAEKLNIQQPNIPRLLKKGSVETEKLVNISILLDYNFFKLFCPEDEVKIQKKEVYPSEFLEDYKNMVIENEKLKNIIAELQEELNYNKKEIAV